MINLLPPEEKGRLVLEKKKRIVIILWLLVLFFFPCLILILFSTKIYLQGQVEVQKITLADVRKESEQVEIKNIREKINLANIAFSELNSFYQQKIYFSEFLEKISKTLPSGVYLTNLSIIFSSTKEGRSIKASLLGFSPTRETLLELKKNIEKEDNFKKVYFPPANWVKATDIDFSVTFEINI